MHHLNLVVISGNVGSSINYGTTTAGDPACGFSIASDKHLGGGNTATLWCRVSCYSPFLVDLCKSKLHKGALITVQGELFSRKGQFGEVIEIRAKDLIFHPSVNRNNETENAEELYDETTELENV